MKQLIFAVLIGFMTSSFSTSENLCITPEERDLYNLLMDYRKQKNLPAIPLSYSLSKVAKLHVYDLVHNKPTSTKCNLHSWSDKGVWKSCCYTSDHKQADGMWSKPQEISQYKSAGFEIAAYFGNGATARGAIANWKKSAGHNEVMINQGSWKKMNWQAVGVGIEGNYAVIWFGAEQDPDQTKLETCDKI